MLGQLSIDMLGVFIGVMRGISGRELKVGHRARPNEGIWHSAQNSVLMGLICIPICGVFWSVFYGLITTFSDTPLPLSRALFDGLLLGLVLAPLIGLFRGGTAFFKHFILRLLLWRGKYIPWNYCDFLEYTRKLRFLYRSGGGYSFLNQALLRYFAELDKMPVDGE